MPELKPAATPPPAAPPATAPDSEIRAHLAATDKRFERLEQTIMRLQPPPPPVAPQEPSVDPLEGFSEGLALPEKSRALLTEGVRAHARDEAARFGKSIQAENSRQLWARDMNMAHTMTMRGNPDMAADREGVLAASGVLEAEVQELRQQGKSMDPLAYYDRLTEIYHKRNPRSTPPPVPLESAGAGGVGGPVGTPAPTEPEPNSYEQDYGFGPGDISDFRNAGGRAPALDKLSEEYHVGKNAALRKEGFYSNLIQVNETAQLEKQRLKQAAAAAR